MGVSYVPFVAKGDGDRCVSSYLVLPRAITPYTTTPRFSFTCNRSAVSTHTVSIKATTPIVTSQKPQKGSVQLEGCYSTRHTPFSRRSVCSSCPPRAGHGGQVVVARGHGEASYANCRHGAGRCSVAGTGGGGRILENPRRCVSPPSDATAVTAPVCPVFRVVVAGRYLVCRFN